MSIFCCPSCQKPLCREERRLVGIDEEAENAHILEAAKKLWGSLNNRVY